MTAAGQASLLRAGLDARGIRWVGESSAPEGLERTRVPLGGLDLSCVYGPGTWGYPDRLECRIQTPEGPHDWTATAEEALEWLNSPTMPRESAV
ncbi:hypothetical protein [Enterorhabdus sp. P55]|uniref:hypothetical protein n=1 Tax=Enterorhabdus sp. P55 TaxID=2304571 RepID=UPI00136CD8A2|nr:hypothetical protein [Enterorhabdus sp. P55]